MELSGIKTGTRLELEIYDDSGERAGPSFPSKFLGAVDDKNAVLDAPIYKGILYPVHVNSEMYVFLISEESLFGFKARVTGRENTGNTAVIKIEQLTEITNIQRRQYFRFECCIPVRYRICDPINHDKSDGIPMKETFTINISGGGLCVKLEENIKLNTFLECELILGENKSVSLIGKVVRSGKRKAAGKYRYEIGISYRKIENRGKEEIIKYIFAEQTRMIRKGLA